MGKKNNKPSTATEDIVGDIQTIRKRKLLHTDASNVDTNESTQEKRNKNNVVANDAKQNTDVKSKQANKVGKHSAADNTGVNLVNGPTKAKRKKKGNNITLKNEALQKNKKIIFNDDGQVQDSPQNIKNENSSNNKRQFLSGEEAAVTEEEIDRFCDELDEEDNVQFDNWVKLIEEKLKPNRNKKT